MSFHKISLIIAKYVAITLCALAVLLTNPWGTQFTLAIVNNFDAIEIDYHSGSFVRDVQLNDFHLQLDNLEIRLKGLETELKFSCLRKKTLCLKATKADEFILHYTSDDESTDQAEIDAVTDDSLFEMPFAIIAESINLGKSHLLINNTEILIDELTTQLAINKSDFDISQPSAGQLIVIITEDTPPTSGTSKTTSETMHSPFTALPEVNLPIALAIKQLQLKRIIVSSKSADNVLTQHWYSSNNALTGDWVNTDVSIKHLQTSTATFSIAELSGTAKLLAPYQINSQFNSELKDFPLWPEIANSNQQVSLQGSFEQLDFELISQGSLALTSQGTINLHDENMPFDIKVSAEKFPLPASFAHYGDPSPFSLEMSGDLKKQTVQLESQLKNKDYKKAQIKLNAIHEEGFFTVNELDFFDSDSNSQLNLQGKLNLNETNISWQVAAKSSGFALPQLNLSNLADITETQSTWATKIPDSISGYLAGTVNSTGSWSEKQWQVAFTETELSGVVNDATISVNADIALNQLGEVKPGKLFIALNDNQLTLNAAGNSFWGIKGHLSIAQMSQWHNDIDGEFTGDFSITGEKSQPVIHLDSQITQLKWQNLHSTTLAIKGSYQPNQNHQLQLSLNNDALSITSEESLVRLDDFQLHINGNASQHHIESQWLGDFVGQLALTGQWDNSFSNWQAAISKSELSYQNIAIQNDSAFTLSVKLADEKLYLDSHCWQGSGLSICLPNQTIIGDSGDIAVKLNIDLSTVDELFLPEDIELISKIDGELTATWSPQKPIQSNAWFNLSSGYLKVSDELGEHQLSEWSSGEWAFAIDEQKFNSKLLITKSDNKTLVDARSIIEFRNDYPINTQVIVNDFNLQPFQTIIANVVSLQGTLNANIAVDGTLKTPIVDGFINLDKGKFQLAQNANTLENIASKIIIKNNEAALAGGFSLDNNEANFNGNITWQNSLAINIDLTGEALPLVFPPQLVMSVSPSLNFNLAEKVLTISGNIDVLDGSYNIEKLPEDSVSLSDDVIIVDQLGQPAAKPVSFDIKTDITVNIAKAFEVTGQGLQSHLFGQLQINQKQNQPFQLFGRIESDNGTFQAYGQRLTIEQGQLTFNGPIDNPYFNLTANRHIKAEDINVGIKVTGLADALNLQLFSSPSMEMPEMLSYLVRGRSLDSGTQNSGAAASLLVGFGVTNSAGLFDQIEKIPLINNIAVDTEGEGDHTQATVSGYIGNRVYLKYGVGVYEPINELTVRMFMFNRFWLEIVSGVEHSTDLYYSFDID